MVDGRPGGQRAGRSAVRRREFLRPSADHGAAIAGAGAARLRRTADRAAQGGRLYQPLCRRRSEEHTSELQSLMRISYAVFCLKKKTPPITTLKQTTVTVVKYHTRITDKTQSHHI